MNRFAFDAGLNHLLNSFAASRPKDDVADTWYQHLQDIPGKEWTIIVKRLVADLDTFPRNLAKAVRSYVARHGGERVDLSTPINPDTGQTYTGRECYDAMRKIEALKLVMADKDNPARKVLLACEQACAKEGDDTATLRRYGAHIVAELDRVIAKSERFENVEMEEVSA